MIIKEVFRRFFLQLFLTNEKQSMSKSMSKIGRHSFAKM